MRVKIVNYAVVLLLGAFCLVGLTQSQPVLIKISADYNPYDFGASFDYYEWETDKLSEMPNLKFYDWNQVLAYGEKKSDDVAEFSIDDTQLKTLIVYKVFWFSRLGSCVEWYPDFWDLFDTYDRLGWKTEPTSFTLYKIFADPKQQKNRDEFYRIAIEVLNDPKTKLAWEAQKKEFLDEARSWAMEYPVYARDFQNMEKSEYQSSVLKAIDTLVKHIDQTDHSQKVIPGGRSWWNIAKAVEGLLVMISDDSPLKLQSLFYRIGPNASKQIKTYAVSAKKQLFIK
ncbi:MAG: hypothetical protein U1B83_09485 [Candidatus Cloacimonadaceae bacterium]|nr:hypothetical protein [Candidatus Cloacimonadaceae bacterium]